MAQVSVNNNSKSVSAVGIHITYIQALSHRGAMHPLGICKISNTNMLLSPLKKCDTLLHPCVASVEPLQLETIHFKKMYKCSQCFLKCYKVHYATKVLILWS